MPKLFTDKKLIIQLEELGIPIIISEAIPSVPENTEKGCIYAVLSKENTLINIDVSVDRTKEILRLQKDKSKL